jgi:hypothetical protein
MRLAALVLVSVLGFARFSAGQAVVPVANAGPDVTVACTGPDGTPVALDGMGSSIGPDFSYLWTAPGVEFTDPTVLTPIGVFPVGVTEVTLTVTFSDPATGEETSATDTALVAITDTAAPMLLVSADPAQLWPPNHKLHDVHVDVLAFDACQGGPAGRALTSFSSEPDDGSATANTDGDIRAPTSARTIATSRVRRARAPASGQCTPYVAKRTDPPATFTRTGRRRPARRPGTYVTAPRTART